MKTRADGVWCKVGVMAVGVALLLGGCAVQSGGPGGARPIYVPKSRRPVVVQAPAAPAPAPVFGRPAETEPATAPLDVPPGQLRSDEVHERNAERKAQHDAGNDQTDEGQQ